MGRDTLSDLRIPAFRPWRELALLALMVMELCWVIPWFRSLTRATYTVPPAKAFLVFAVIMLGFNWIVRLMNYLNLRMIFRRAILIILLVLSILLALKTLLYTRDSLSLADLINRPLGAFNDWNNLIPDEILIALVALYVFYRGMILAQIYIEPAALRRSYLLGIGMFLAYIFINTTATGETPGGLIYLFFLAAMIGMIAARITIIGSLRGGGSNPFDRQWLISIFASAVLVVGLATGLGVLIGGRMALFGQVGTMLLGLFALIMVAIISPLVYAAQSLASRSSSAAQTLQEMVAALEGLRNTLLEFTSKFAGMFARIGILDWITRFKSVILWGVLIAAGLAILVNLTQWALKERESQKDERQTLITGGNLLKLLQLALQRRMKNFGDSLLRIATLRRGQRFLAAMRIRRIYAELMDLSEKLGKKRAPAETPLEFLPELAELFPTLDKELNVITDAYLLVRYGGFPETRQEIDHVEAAWEGVRIQGQKQLEFKRKQPARQSG